MINATHHHIIVISVAINPSRSIIELTAVDLIDTTTIGRRHEIDDLVQRLESGAQLRHLSGQDGVLRLDLRVKLSSDGETRQDLTVVVRKLIDLSR